MERSGQGATEGQLWGITTAGGVREPASAEPIALIVESLVTVPNKPGTLGSALGRDCPKPDAVRGDLSLHDHPDPRAHRRASEPNCNCNALILQSKYVGDCKIMWPGIKPL